MENSKEENSGNEFLKILKEFLDSINSLSLTIENSKRKIPSKIIPEIVYLSIIILDKFKKSISENEEFDWSNTVDSVKNVSSLVNQLHLNMQKEENLSLNELNELNKILDQTRALVEISQIRNSAAMGQLFENNNDSIKNRENLINSKLKEFEEKIEKQFRSVESISQNASSQMQDMQGSARAALENLKRTYEKESENFSDKNKKTNELLIKLSTGVLLGGHSGRAIEELRQANFFRLLTIILMSGVIFFAYEIYKSANEISSYMSLATRIGMIFAVLLLITYFARESGKHRVLGNRYYQTALDLKALDPYISDLSVEIKERIKADLAIRMFFVYDNREVQESAPLNAQEIIMKLMDLASKNKS